MRWRQRVDDRGATSVEYGLLIGLVGLASLGAVNYLVDQLQPAYRASLSSPGVVACPAGTLSCDAYGQLPAAAVPPPALGSVALPAITTRPPSDVTGDAATLHADVNPNDVTSTVVSTLTIKFASDQAVLIGGGGTAAPVFPPQATGASLVSASAPIGGLAAGERYYFQAFATNSAGTTSGLILSFTTLGRPLVTTLPVDPSTIGLSTARLTAVVNANGSDTTDLSIRYSEVKADVDSGTGTDATIDPTLATGTTDTTVTAELLGLDPGTTYYFRASATNDAGTTDGETLSFTTTMPTCAVLPLKTVTVPKNSGPYTITVLSGIPGGVVSQVTPNAGSDGAVATESPLSAKVRWSVNGANKTWSGSYSYSGSSCVDGTGTLLLKTGS